MGHCIRGFVGQAEIFESATQRYSQARIAPLIGSWKLLPLTDALAEELDTCCQADTGHELTTLPWPLNAPQDGLLRAVEAAFGQRLSQHGPVAYIETDYFGGRGKQCAVAWDQGDVITSFQTSGDVGPVKPGPINAALRAIGVSRHVVQDEFESLGLQHYRELDAFDHPEGRYWSDDCFGRESGVAEQEVVPFIPAYARPENREHIRRVPLIGTAALGHLSGPMALAAITQTGIAGLLISILIPLLVGIGVAYLVRRTSHIVIHCGLYALMGSLPSILCSLPSSGGGIAQHSGYTLMVHFLVIAAGFFLLSFVAALMMRRLRAK